MFLNQRGVTQQPTTEVQALLKEYEEIGEHSLTRLVAVAFLIACPSPG